MSENSTLSFTIGKKKYQVTAPKGRAGRKAAAYVMNMFSKFQTSQLVERSEMKLQGMTDEDIDNSIGGFADSGGIMELVTDETFEEKYMSAFIGVPQEILDIEGTITELLQAVMITITVLFEGFEMPEVDAALKNSEAEQQTEQETK